MAKKFEDFLTHGINTMLENNGGELPSFAWPGGYPMYYIDGDSSVLCPKCANKQLDEAKQEVEEGGEPIVPRFLPQEGDINYDDESLYCVECSTPIECGYC